MRYGLSLGAGVVVGLAYGLSSIKSPAPPIVALLGLLGIVAGEQLVIFLRS